MAHPRLPMKILILLAALLVPMAAFTQTTSVPPIESGVSLELAKWRAAHYSDVRYKLNLTLEKMSPVLKGTIEIRVKVSEPPASAGGRKPAQAETRPVGSVSPIILDWRPIKGHEEKSTISNVTINGRTAIFDRPRHIRDGISRYYAEMNEHLVFYDNVVEGENVIKLDFTSPILTSGSAITRYIDKEDGSEYLYSLFVPSDASTALPVFDQPDLKARFQLSLTSPIEWAMVSNGDPIERIELSEDGKSGTTVFRTTFPISTYVFSFAAGNFLRVEDEQSAIYQGGAIRKTSLYVRKSQVEKFKPHAAEVFRLNREAIKYFEEYFDYTFPFPKYDLVLIPEFPFGGMEHAGATFLRESSIMFPQEPTKNDHISRALLIFHEASHQWFGDTVTMRWFDDLWLKEGFATFTAYKAMERIMPEMNAWKVFYERVKQAAYQTDSTKGTTPIYQEINNLSAAKSAYGNIVYNKAPAFLRQAEFYLGEDKFQTAVRAFLKKHEFGNAGWEDLVREFESTTGTGLSEWAAFWVKRPGLGTVRMSQIDPKRPPRQIPGFITLAPDWTSEVRVDGFPPDAKMPLMKGVKYARGSYRDERLERGWSVPDSWPKGFKIAEYEHYFIFPNYKDYGYGIFLLDVKSREYVLKNIQNEKDPFLRSMMWGALWDSVREGELDPREYVELVVKVLVHKPAREQGRNTRPTDDALANARAYAEEDESTTALLLSRVGTAMNYYIDDSRSAGLRPRVEDMLIERMRNAETLGQRITYYRAFLNVAGSEKARGVLKQMLTAETQSRGDVKRELKEAFKDAQLVYQIMTKEQAEAFRRGEETAPAIPLKTKDKFDIVTRLLILGDPEAPKLLAKLEKTETSDEAKRYAYAARGGIATAENKAKYWNDFVNNKEIAESWIEAAFGPWNSIRHADLTLPYLERALKELPNHKRNRKIFFVNGWLGAFIGGQRSEEALNLVNEFLADNPTLDRDLRLKILENVDVIERAVRIRKKY